MITRELAGDFLMYFYSNGFILGNRVSSRNFVGRKFVEFLKKSDRTLGAYDNDTTLDEILNKFNFVCPNIRDEKIYKFDLKELFKYRNELIAELDRNQIQNTNTSISNTEELNEAVSSNVTLKLLDDFPSYKLIFEFRIRQQKVESFTLSSKGCYCCQMNFKTEDEYMAHIDYHSQESDFEYRSRNKIESLSQQFAVSYKLCEKAQLLFTIKSIHDRHDIIIEKIIVFRSGAFHYLEDGVVPYFLPSDGSNFYVNCHIFQIAHEQPFLIVYKSKDDPKGFRNVEEHHFLRFDVFPATISFRTNHVMRRGELKMEGKLPTYPPSPHAKAMHLADFDEANHPIKRTLRSFFKKLTPLSENNICDVFDHLIEMEDFALSRSYERFKQSGVKAEGCGSDYSVKLKAPSDGVSMSNVLTRGDRINLISKVGLRNGKKNSNGKTNEAVAKFFGMITSVVGERVYFECKAGKVATDLTYDVSFEPNRLNIIYQHRALEILRSDIHLRARLFPENIGCNIPVSLRLDYFNSSLAGNCEQSEAVQNIVQNSNKHVPFVIFGPPGTGKTTVVVETILQLWKKSNTNKILVMAGSNAACDEIASRLSKVFRKTDPDSINFLRLYAMSCESRMDNMNQDVLETSNLCYGQHFYPSLETIYSYPIVIATLTVAGRLVHGKISINHFTHLFIDECGASTEPESLIGLAGILSSSGHLILSGDPKQLGPIIECRRAADYGLERSLMERLMERDCYAQHPLTKEYNKTIQARLVHNYRSHKDILALSNELYYDNALIPVAPPEITDVGLGWCRLRRKTFPIVFESVKGVMRQMKNSTSYCNNEEINCVMLNLKELMYFGIKDRKLQQTDIGIISPYKLQCDLIRRELDRRGWFHIETGSVETFQGQEKSVIIASMVRSRVNTPGFLDNCKRINVLLTRAQALLILVGNPETLSKIGHWKTVVDYCIENNAVIGVQFTKNDNDSNESDSTLAESIKSLSVKDNRIMRNNHKFQNQKNNHTKNKKVNYNLKKKTANNNKLIDDTKNEATINEVDKEESDYWNKWLAELPSVANINETTGKVTGDGPALPEFGVAKKFHIRSAEQFKRGRFPKDSFNVKNNAAKKSENNINTANSARTLLHDRNRLSLNEFNRRGQKRESKGIARMDLSLQNNSAQVVEKISMDDSIVQPGISMGAIPKLPSRDKGPIPSNSNVSLQSEQPLATSSLSKKRADILESRKLEAERTARECLQNILSQHDDFKRKQIIDMRKTDGVRTSPKPEIDSKAANIDKDICTISTMSKIHPISGHQEYAAATHDKIDRKSTRTEVHSISHRILSPPQPSAPLSDNVNYSRQPGYAASTHDKIDRKSIKTDVYSISHRTLSPQPSARLLYNVNSRQPVYNPEYSFPTVETRVKPKSRKESSCIIA